MGAAVKSARGSGKTRHKQPSGKRYASPLDKAKPYEVKWQQVCGVFDAARRIQEVTFIYFIGEGDDGPLKIGKAKDPIARLRSMQTGNSRRLCIERLLIGSWPAEKLLHEFWEPYAIFSASNDGKADALPGTEWFRPEIREELFPIIETAAGRQIDFAHEVEGNVSHTEFERIVRKAHIDHDFVAKGRDTVRLLATWSGYSARRRSRI